MGRLLEMMRGWGEEVVQEMYEVAEQMGKDMPIGLRGNFEYRGARERVRFEETEGTD